MDDSSSSSSSIISSSVWMVMATESSVITISHDHDAKFHRSHLLFGDTRKKKPRCFDDFGHGVTQQQNLGGPGASLLAHNFCIRPSRVSLFDCTYQDACHGFPPSLGPAVTVPAIPELSHHVADPTCGTRPATLGASPAGRGPTPSCALAPGSKFLGTANGRVQVAESRHGAECGAARHGPLCGSRIFPNVQRTGL